MKKSNDDKKMNRIAKGLNRQLERDVFKDRFTVHQLKKVRGAYYLYELRDKEQPERNQLIGWVDVYSGRRILFLQMNDFIIKSNFWELYRGKQNIQKD